MTTLALMDPDEPRKRRKAQLTSKPKAAKPSTGKRNVNGEGNIRQRSNGLYEGRAYVITTDGREVRKSVYGKTWEEVHQKLTKMQADTMSGKRVASSTQTVAEYLDYWLEEHARHRVRDTTFASYKWLITKYLVPLFGKKKLTTLRPNDVRRGLFQLQQVCQCCAQGKDKAREERAEVERKKREGRPPRKNAKAIQGARCCALVPQACCRSTVSDGTVRYLHRLLRAVLQDAVSEDEILTENIAKKLRLNHKYRPKFKAWSRAEATKFLESIREDRLYALYAVALSLGLRRGEALGLRWSDVDLDNSLIRVNQALHRVDGALKLGDVKTDGSTRLIAVPKPLVSALRVHRAAQAQEKKNAGKSWQDGGYVFSTMIGTPIEPRNMNRHFDRLCEKAGVRRIRFHDLRHSCASLLYSQGVPLENIQDVLGHSSPTVTKVIYVDVAEDVTRDAVDRLGFLFGEHDEE
ncbi:site-specific integrase [Kribbella sp. NBC_01484]|uniref:tyrosine-type recombinase/integrase n=1 Tax=Kribbella sp. NBC_01484 TaxID=2903579 RepID=UPI002E35D45E|nr:site-specific integrase [Kribbella sp. NBC_01484]